MHQSAPAKSRVLPNTGLREPWRALAHCGWILLVLLQALIFVVGASSFYGEARRPCASTNPSTECLTLSPGGFAALGRLGLSPDGIAVLELTVVLAVSVIFCASGALIAWRKWNEGMGLYVSLVLIAFGATGGGLLLSAVHVLQPHLPQGMSMLPWIRTPNRTIGFWRYPAFGAFLLTFPTGRFTPRWSWLLLLLWFVPFVMVASSNLTLLFFFVTGAFGSALAVQIYRYRHVYGPVQRQQSKWLVLAMAITVSLTCVGALSELNPELSALVGILTGPQGTNTILPIAIAVAIALLHYRLYDIDILINRALIYGSLTATLALIYIALVLGAQLMLQTFTGQAGQQPVIIVASTLLIAALFAPLRRRIQAVVNQRFYRRRYDAVRTVAAFGATLRTETDLTQLSQGLVAVVEETMQPAHVSLWLLLPAHSAP
jgi:hypothetical protein